MASEEDQTVYNEEDLDDDEDDDEEDYDLKPSHITPAPLTTTTMALNPSQDDVVVDDEDDEVDVDDDDVDDSTSSSNLATADPSLLIHHHHHLPPPPLPSPVPLVVVPRTGEVTVALPADHDPKRQLIDDVAVPATAAAASVAVVEGKKPQVPLDESRRLFQRLWTDEDEIELLQGFLEYTSSRGAINSSHHHDTTVFYDQIKNRLQLDFNKNQLVEKLRRLKKKYRNVMNKIGSGKEYVFKSAHDQATFEISRKIWSGSGVGSGGGGAPVRSGVVAEEGGFDDEDANTNFSVHLIDQSPNPNPNPNGVDFNSFEKKTPRPRKRSRGGGVKVEEKQYGFNSIPNMQYKNQNHNVQNMTPPAAVVTPSATASATAIGTSSSSVTNLIEETVKSCLSPIFKELLNGVMNLNGPMGGSRGLGFGFALNPMPLGLNGDLLADEKWRKQQILELEVYSKRLELVQDQIKAQLEELRAMGG